MAQSLGLTLAWSVELSDLLAPLFPLCGSLLYWEIICKDLCGATM